MPDDGLLVAELRGADGGFLAETRLATGGRQVPIPFAVALPAGIEATLQVALYAGGRPAWVSSPVAIAAGSGDLALGAIALERHTPMGFATRLRCGDTEIEVGFIDDIARLAVAGEIVDLKRVPAASGARFEAEGDAGTFYWSRGQAAMVSVRGVLLPECVAVVPRP